ncbi:MAG: lycopene cyclase domain-containing protein [Actinomycetes bacterium]
MTYTQLGFMAVVAMVVVDLSVLRTRLVRRRVFWTSYAIILFFQLLTNGMFTGFGIVKYHDEAIIGGTSPATGPPAFLGDGRIAFAPVEDLLFGFALVLMSLSLWIFWGRRGLDRTPHAGPPIWRRDDASSN